MESRSLKLKRLLAIDSSDLLYNYISKSEIIFTSIKKKKNRTQNKKRIRIENTVFEIKCTRQLFLSDLRNSTTHYNE